MPDERGPIDWDALRAVEGVFRDRLNGLVTDAEYVPDAIDPVELRVTLAAGFDADRCRFDVQWWTNHGYKYHYSEADLEFRFGWEIRPSSPGKHFHPPGNPTEHRESCITHEEPELVTLAVIKCWWDALEAGDLAVLNSNENQP
ncbi:hypothetical protein A6E15_05300 [Natrinema saccharevitans]|uniref:Uncharacterized protein n=1 Tax=Natrinema saccharevitans TaxID=301967 RepID=A0A1S8AU68_9EURY|nr:hypothetical protein [Natrinema saccharevitans]OLZ40438.1 hypothetical protein A6E15_05300 [Natrinema saccharevitans]